MRKALAIAMLLVGCGGTIDPLPLSVPLTAPTPAPPQPARVVTDAQANSLSGRDCSITPCPAVANLQCLSIATKRECFFVLAPGDGCLTVKVDRTSTGEVTPIICTAICGGSDLPGATFCPNGLTCSNDAARVCFH